MTMHDVIFHLVARTRFRWTGIDTRERAVKRCLGACLRNKDPESLMLGLKAVMVVIDGDEGSIFRSMIGH